ncbi:MAG: efflux RND transporter permease subunit, partial [Cytophagales bacterium]|nr:efflux RND transporter permease subunit [Cytophagales bacterium]
QKLLKTSFPNEIENVVAKIGTSEIPTDPMPLEAIDLVVSLKDEKQWTTVHHKADLTDGISKILEGFPGITFSIMQPIENRFNDMLSGAKTDVVIKVFGDDLAILAKKGDEIASILRPLEGARDVQVQKVSGLPQVIVKYDRKILASYGIPMSDVSRVVQTAFAGSKAGIIYEGEKRFDLSIRLASEDRNSVEDLGGLLVEDKNKNLIPLKELAEITVEKGPAEISRENGQRRLNVGFNVRGRDVKSLVNEAQGIIAQKLVLPDGYYLDYGGSFENLERAMARLTIVVPLSLLIIFVLLFITFGKVKESLIIYAAIPLSAVGGIYALWFRDMSLSISAGIGFIALFGVAVLNGILLIGQFKSLKDQHHMDNVYRRVLTGIKERFRQVLMTSATAALGFIPMALSHSAGAEVQKPLATVVIGGLVTSTALTLIVLPVMYIIFCSKKEDEDED